MNPYLFVVGVFGGALIGVIVTRLMLAKRFAADLSYKLAAVHAAYNSQNTMQGEELRNLREQNEECVKIALYLRENYKEEIATGRHAGRSLSDIINGYLATERAVKKLA